LPKNDIEAVKWYRKAAKQGYASAQHSLGVMYEWGWGVPKDAATAVKWYRKSAKQGDRYGQRDLGLSYANGHGVPKNKEKAYIWLERAVAQGKEDACKMRDEIAAQLTPAQLARAKKAASQPLDVEVFDAESTA
jgi:TPR repeat protein